MEFISKMKKREFIEMGLKAFAALCIAFIAVILMEGMIYGIQLHALKTNGGSSFSLLSSSTAYCVKESEDKYYVIFDLYSDGETWTCQTNKFYSLEDLTKENLKVKEVVMHAPNAFQLTITPLHYVIISLFMTGVAGFFVYKAIALSKSYQKIEKTFKETGIIEF